MLVDLEHIGEQSLQIVRNLAAVRFVGSKRLRFLQVLSSSCLGQRNSCQSTVAKKDCLFTATMLCLRPPRRGCRLVWPQPYFLPSVPPCSVHRHQNVLASVCPCGAAGAVTAQCHQTTLPDSRALVSSYPVDLRAVCEWTAPGHLRQADPSTNGTFTSC